MNFDIDKQWDEWSNNRDKNLKCLSDDELKKLIIDDLDFVSKMDVKEYTLYQKWCEIHEKYPTVTTNTLFGEEVQFADFDQQKMIEKVKGNFWMPKEPDDYLKLDPVMEYTDDSGFDFTESILTEERIKILRKRNQELPETWNTIRTFSSTMKNNANIGRNLNFIVKDRSSGNYLGVICISSDFLDLTPRDNYIGWARDKKTQGGMINYTAIGSTIVPLQPLGFNYVGGKLLALLCLSDDVQRLWKEKYGNTLVGVTTTSLYGQAKNNGVSQYDNLDHWLKMGFSSGSVSFEPSRNTRYRIREWLEVNHTRKYFEWYVAKRSTGQPYKRDHKNRSLIFTYSKLGIPKNLIRTEHYRGIYFSPLYNNTCDFLRSEITEDKLIKSFDTSTEALANLWKTKFAKGRISMLKKKNNVSYETLFYDDLVTLSWNETKEKYLPQVGR